MTNISDDAHIGRVALRVNDLDKMTEFYETVIGLRVLSEDDGRTVLGADEDVLVLIADEDAEPRQRDETGLFHTAFLVPTRAALGDVLNRVEEHWELDGASDHLVSEALYFTDSEGNGIEVYTDRPQSEWQTDEDGMVQMATQRLDLTELRKQAEGKEYAPDGTTVGHVHLEVSDLNASRQFYVDTLGLNVRQAMPTALFVAADDYHHHIGMNTWNHRTQPASGRGLDWYELVIPDKITVEELRERCRENGYDVNEQGNRFVIADPDGITVRIREEKE